MDRTQQVVLEGNQSSSCTVDSGVPQGTVLSPLLFLVFINNLPNSRTSHARPFADNCLLRTTIKTRSDQRQLQEDLNSLAHLEL